MPSRPNKRQLEWFAPVGSPVRADSARPPPRSARGPGRRELAQWAHLLCPLLGPALAAGGILNWITVGAADGVTVANQFDTQVSPDGNTAMLLSGSAAMAQLVGDPRARFDPSQWVAGLAGVSSTLVMGRVPLAEFPANVPMRVLAADPTGSDLPTLLGLTLLGYNVTPVTPQTILGDARTAVLHGQIDIATVSNADAGDLMEWRQAGLTPLFTLGTINEAGDPILDPAFPGLPSLENLLAAKGG